jgi:Flp pilus assembly protein TadD
MSHEEATVRRSTVLIAVLAMLFYVIADAQNFQESSALETSFTTVSGVVTDEAGQPVEGVRVGIREADVDPNTVPSTTDFGAWGVDVVPAETFSDPSRDREIFAWDETDRKGRYALTGVRRPGAYIVIIANPGAFHRVDAPISVASAVGNSFKVDLVLRALVGAAPPAQVTVEGLVTVAREAEQTGDLQTAFARIEEVAALAPESPVPHFHLARLAVASGDTERAIAEIDTACELDAACGDCWLLRAEIAHAVGHAEEALTSASKAAELMPESSDAQGVFGLRLYEAQRYGEALPCLERAVELGSADPNVFVYRANCYVAGRRIDDAIAAYEDFLQRFPEAPNRDQVEQILPQLKVMAGDQ